MEILYSIPGLRKAILLWENYVFNAVYGKRFSHRVSIFGFPVLSLARSSTIAIGENLVLISASYFSEPGVDHPVVIRTLTPRAKLEIGDNVGISGGGIVVAQRITIGNNVMFGANVFVTDTDFHPIDPQNRRFRKDNVLCAEVVIEDNVFIGMNTLVLKGARIGANSVIGAGSVVTSNIPPNCIAAGVPARVIRALEI